MEVWFILDASLSMEDQEETLVTAVNDFLTKLRNNPDGAAANKHVRIYTFNEDVQLVTEGELRDIKLYDYMYVAERSTALYHTICTLVPTCPDESTIIIATDGIDTEPHDSSREDASNAIATARQRGVHFIYLAQGQEAFEQGNAMGLQAVASQSLSQSIMHDDALFLSVSQSIGFDDEEESSQKRSKTQ